MLNNALPVLTVSTVPPPKEPAKTATQDSSSPMISPARYASETPSHQVGIHLPAKIALAAKPATSPMETASLVSQAKDCKKIFA